MLYFTKHILKMLCGALVAGAIIVAALPATTRSADALEQQQLVDKHG
jgi:hypothetical protein